MATLPPHLASFVAPPHVAEVLRCLRGAGHAAYLVGGSVRDLLLGKAPSEFDIATGATPEEVTACFPHVVPTGVEHGTVTVVIEHEPIEVTTFRGEGPYLDGRRPSSVRFHREIDLDLARRDLTVNAMAFDPVSGELVDPHGGREDLARRCVRAVGDPDVRFNEDGLRIMRAVRFASVLGFVIHPETRRAIPRAIPTFRKVAVERIQIELTKLVVGPRPRYGVELLRRTGILREILPELLEGFGMRQNRWHRYDVYHHVLRALDASVPEPAVRLAVLLHDIDKPRTAAPRGEDGDLSFFDHERTGAERAREILLRLRYAVKLADRVALLVREHQFVYTPEWSDAAVRRMLARVGEENVDELFAVRVADVIGRGRAVEEGLADLEALADRVKAVRATRPALGPAQLAVDGRDVMQALGVGPSPRVGQAMRHLVDLVLEDPGRNTREGLLAALADWRPEGS